MVSPDNPFIEFPRAAIEQSLPERFEQQAALYAERCAVKTARQAISYADLNALANRIAHSIVARRGTGTEPVALLFAYDAPVFAAILGVQKAGKFYLPLDAANPRARLLELLADSEAPLIVCDGTNYAPAVELAGDERRVIGIDTGGLSDTSENPRIAIAPDALACLLYTSGSTGRPKGVLHTHRNLLHVTMSYTNSIHVSPDDRHALFTSLSFGGAIWSVYGALFNGACLCPKDVKSDGTHDLADWMVEERISIYSSPTSLFRHFVAGLDGSERFPDLRLVSVGGEPVRRNDVELFRKHFRAPCLLRNGMASTETTSVCCYFIGHEGDFPGNLMPVGYLLPDKEVLLLDDDGQEVGVQRAGEMIIRSQFMSLGYWRRPELTAERFSADPDDPAARLYRTGDLGYRLLDGCLIHLGRKDFQVKIRGHRVEIAEIETALLMVDGVREALVMAREDTPGEMRLVAYVVPTGEPIFASALRAALAQTLPLEMQLSDIWSELLQVEGIGLHDRFIDLGGDSLLAARVGARVMRSFAVEAPMAELLQAGTVAEMAVMVLGRQIAALPEGLRKATISGWVAD